MLTRDNSADRIVFDVSSMVRWIGPPVGIVRVERELSGWARRNLDNVVFAFLDPETRQYRELSPRYASALLSGESSIDTFPTPPPGRRGNRATERIPAAVRPATLWVLQFRHMLLRALERARLRTASTFVAGAIDKLQRALMSAKYRYRMVGRDGVRRPLLSPDMACGDVFEFRNGDTLVCAGSGWMNNDPAVIAERKQQSGVRVVLLCHDIIPLLFPQFYEPHDVEAFRDYFHAMLPITDLVVTISQRGLADLRSYCTKHGVSLGPAVASPLGTDAVTRRQAGELSLPAGLQAGKYILFVSTIEPRKGHGLLYEIWLRLLAEGIPQQAGFNLVFVGRPGWMVDDLMRKLTQDTDISDSLQMLHGVDDRMLDSLYEGTAFCVYPSVYEGYGLPVVEAFSYGKAVLSSNGGALAEVVGNFSPSLDPTDVDAWYRAIKSWIEDPAARAPYEEAIRTRFRHLEWDEAAARFFACVEGHDEFMGEDRAPSERKRRSRL